MTFRKLKPTVTRPGVQVVVGRDDATGEYRCRLTADRVQDPAADYFTVDRDDAFGTATQMANRAYGHLVRQKALALTNDTLTITSLKGIVSRIWQQIGPDVPTCGGELDNEAAIELCLDADKPLIFDSREAQALCKLAYEKYGFDAVCLAVSKTLNLV